LLASRTLAGGENGPRIAAQQDDAVGAAIGPLEIDLRGEEFPCGLTTAEAAKRKR